MRGTFATQYVIKGNYALFEKKSTSLGKMDDFVKLHCLKHVYNYLSFLRVGWSVTKMLF